ncbi:hypothetical protein KAX97_15095 [candidate division WOR-3 bacterium]|nr:hypothetical protein [candidate division WOR-3 bacterium]
MTESNIPFVILIDTNAMTALSLYVQSCTTVKVALGTTVEELKTRFREIKNTKDTQLYFEGRGGIKEGYKFFNYLESKIEEFNNVQIWFSLLSEIELLDVFLDRTFDIELTRKGIPYIIRKKKLFRMQIEFNYEEKVAKNWEDIKQKLAQDDIEFNNPEKESDVIQDVKEIAKIVTRYIALGSVDLYIYALGIYLKANEIYTHDQELRGIINNICNKHWRNIYDSIQLDLRKYIITFREEYKKEKKIDLPKGVS